MSHTDEQLRTLSSWLPGLRELKETEDQITRVWEQLKVLRVKARETRERLHAECPLELDDLEFRFWTKVAIVDDENSCWEWTGGRSPLPDNYGSFRWRHPRTGMSTVSPSSVVAMFLTDGCLPSHQGNHHCDNPPCSRPKHLYDGTHAENMRDKSERGRGRTRDQTGETNHQAKLNEAMVITARNSARAGMKLREIHELLGKPCHDQVLRWAINGRTWKHLNGACPPVVKRQGQRRS